MHLSLTLGETRGFGVTALKLLDATLRLGELLLFTVESAVHLVQTTSHVGDQLLARLAELFELRLKLTSVLLVLRHRRALVTQILLGAAEVAAKLFDQVGLLRLLIATLLEVIEQLRDPLLTFFGLMLDLAQGLLSGGQRHLQLTELVAMRIALPLQLLIELTRPLGVDLKRLDPLMSGSQAFIETFCARLLGCHFLAKIGDGLALLIGLRLRHRRRLLGLTQALVQVAALMAHFRKFTLKLFHAATKRLVLRTRLTQLVARHLRLLTARCELTFTALDGAACTVKLSLKPTMATVELSELFALLTRLVELKVMFRAQAVELMRDLISFALRRAQALPKVFGFDLAPRELFFELSALAALLFELTLRALVLRLDKIELLLEIADLALALRKLGAQLDQGLLLLSLVFLRARQLVALTVKLTA